MIIFQAEGHKYANNCQKPGGIKMPSTSGVGVKAGIKLIGLCSLGRSSVARKVTDSDVKYQRLRFYML